MDRAQAGPNPSASSTVVDHSTTSATSDLYRAAIGPVNTDYYDRIFAHFEARDRAGISWNLAAALITVQWMAFRQLWGAALAYVGAVVTAIVLLFGIGRLVFHFSPTEEWSMAAGCAALMFAIPGLFGNALLHKATRKKMAKALEANTTVAEACDMLRRDASSKMRMVWIALANVLVLGAVVGVTKLIPDADRLPLTSSKMGEARNVTLGQVTNAEVPAARNAASAPASVSASASAPASVPAAASAPAQAVTPVQAPIPVVKASAAAIAASSAAAASSPVATSAPAASSARSASNAIAASPSARAASRPAFAASAAPGNIAQRPPMPGRSALAADLPRSPEVKPQPAVTVPAAVAASVTASTPAKPKALQPKPPVQAQAQAQAQVASKAQAPKVAAAPAVAAVVAPQFMVNVGLFADENNARNAHTQLTDAGLPASQQAVKGPRGRFTRVRVGPYETEAQAQTAADKIQALGLDAMVVKP
jgi:cell division protein FtsN